MRKLVEKHNGTFIKSDGIIPYNSISKIETNERSDRLEIKYINVKRKEQKLKITFLSPESAIQMSNIIAEKTKLTKSITMEDKNKAMLRNTLPILSTAFLTYQIAFKDLSGYVLDPSNARFSKYGRKTEATKYYISTLQETFDQTNLMIIGSIITLYFAYRLWSKYKNPANDIIYQ